MINVDEKKDKIISYLEREGPNLPVRIARVIEMEPMFTMAIISELMDSKKVKTSNMKVGASPLYFIPGQEEKLENFADNLKSIERNAFELLKDNKVLFDEEQEPAIRVALRGLKDFAIPLRIDEKIVWKYFLVEDLEVKNLLMKNEVKEEVEDVLGVDIEDENLEENLIDEDLEEEKENLVDEDLEKISETQDSEEIFEEENVPKAWEKKTEKKEIEVFEEEKKTENIFDEDLDEPDFLKEVKKFLNSKNMNFLKEIKVEKKEIMAEVGVGSDLGEIVFMLVAKDKKTVNKDDLDSAVRLAKNNNMPCLVVIRKEPSKNIQKILSENNLVKLEVMV